MKLNQYSALNVRCSLNELRKHILIYLVSRELIARKERLIMGQQFEKICTLLYSFTSRSKYFLARNVILPVTATNVKIASHFDGREIAEKV